MKNKMKNKMKKTNHRTKSFQMKDKRPKNQCAFLAKPILATATLWFCITSFYFSMHAALTVQSYTSYPL